MDKVKKVLRRFGLWPSVAREVVPTVFMWLGILAIGIWSAEITQAISRSLGSWGVYIRIPGAVSFWLLLAVIYRAMVDDQ